MKHVKKLIFMLALCMAMVLAINVKPAQAATAFKVISAYSSSPDEYKTVGGAKFSMVYDSNYKTNFYVTINGTKKSLSAMKGASGEFLSNGSTIYFVKTLSGKAYIYKTTVKNASPVRIKVISASEGLNLKGYYSGKIYYVTGFDPGTFYSLRVSTGTVTKLASNTTHVDQSGKYFYLRPYSGAYGPIKTRIYNAETGKITTLCSTLLYLQTSSKYVYYARMIKKVNESKYEMKVIRANLDGTGAKTLVPSLTCAYINKITTSTIEYTVRTSTGSYVQKTKRY